VATSGGAPYRAVLTHGFVLDEKGQKMSKSLGNVIDPMLVIDGGNNEKQARPHAHIARLRVARVDT
jgi:isoleucyl-tRNA synthetase